MSLADNERQLPATIASGIDYVLDQHGVAALRAGTFLINRQLQPSFRDQKVAATADYPAAVHVGSLPEAEGLEALLIVDRHFAVDILAKAIDRQFLNQAPDIFRQAMDERETGSAAARPSSGCLGAIVVLGALPTLLLSRWAFA